MDKLFVALKLEFSRFFNVNNKINIINNAVITTVRNKKSCGMYVCVKRQDCSNGMFVCDGPGPHEPLLREQQRRTASQLVTRVWPVSF